MVGRAGDDLRAGREPRLRGRLPGDRAYDLVRPPGRREERRVDACRRADVLRPRTRGEVVEAALERPVPLDPAGAGEAEGDVVVGAEHGARLLPDGRLVAGEPERRRADCCVTGEPVRARTLVPESSRRSSSTSAAARASFCWIEGRSGRPTTSRRMTAGTMPLTPTAATAPTGRSQHSSRQREHTFAHHSPGSSSAQPGCGERSCAGRSAWATTRPAGSTRAAFVALVPTSIPRSRLTASSPARRQTPGSPRRPVCHRDHGLLAREEVGEARRSRHRTGPRGSSELILPGQLVQRGLTNSTPLTRV